MNLREREADSIAAFILSAREELSGWVLDYGCGKQPYRGIVEAAGGKYLGFDRADFPASVTEEAHGPDNVLAFGYTAILCTQVLQYVPNPRRTLRDFRRALWRRNGKLVLTYPTSWPEVEPEDLHRFTKAGMERLLTEAEFGIERHEPRHVAATTDSGEPLVAGYGVVART